MFIEDDNNNELNISIDDLFRDPEPEVQPREETSEEPQPNMTKAVSERINTVRRKTEAETQDRIAKELGYDSYEAMQKANEQKMLRDAGLDEEEIGAVVEKLVQKRLAEDPRLKKLEEIEANEKANFVTAQLKEINELGNNFASIDELPKETLDMWEKIGDLKQAYLATQGEALLKRRYSNQDKGSLRHLASPDQSSVGTKTRKLTESEKAIWRSVMPDITEEELSKKTMTID